VEERGWLAERPFADALNFCMLLPGPEALQLAIYVGWKLHGVRGGLVAGLGFVLPSVALLLGLAWVYARFGAVPAVAGVLFGLKSAVVALVLQALARIGRHALHRPLHWALAVATFAALEFTALPFPLILIVAALLGVGATRGVAPPAPIEPAPAGGARAARVLGVGFALWGIPLAAVGLSLGLDSLWGRLYLFFTQAALVTFGGAYAVLAYVTQHLVSGVGWVTAEQSVAGLALAETTPGPLIIVLQFMGFMAGWNRPAPLEPAAGAVLAALLAAWATFLPSFVFIFLGAPHLERLTRNPRIAAALAAITAAVVGIIATLAWLLAKVVWFPAGVGAGPRWGALVIAACAAWLLARRRPGLLWVLGLASLSGLLLQ